MKPESTRVFKKGRIRVDARKAMAKLREHLLVDLHLYAVELVRAAVSANATCVDIRYDADDVEVSFDVVPIEADALPHLFEHLTADDVVQRPHERLLALAVNAALGLRPAWVTLTTFQDGIAKQVAWSPELVAAIEREEKPLPKVQVVQTPFPTFGPNQAKGSNAAVPNAAVPNGAVSNAAPSNKARNVATRFHFRRRPGWDVVRRAATRVLPREVELVAEAATLPRVPIFINGAPLASKKRSKVLVSASFLLPSAITARVEILAGHNVAPHVEFHELGLLLCTAGFSFGRYFPMAEHAGIRPPLRLVVDSNQLPTNASRSSVREDADVFQSLGRLAAPALSDSIAAVIFTLFAKGTAPSGVDVDTADPLLLEDALGAFLCFAEAAIVGRGPLPEALRPLMELPFFQDALGRPLTRNTLPKHEPLLLWSGNKPAPEETEPWAHEIVWKKGRVAESIFVGRNLFNQEKLIALIGEGAKQKQKLLAMPKGKVSVPDDDNYIAREPLNTTLAGTKDEEFFNGLCGEVAIAPNADSFVRNMGVRVFLEGRYYEAYPLPEDAVPLPCLIALEWPDVIRPRLGYRGIESHDKVRMALALAVKQAVFLCEKVALRFLLEGAAFDGKSGLHPKGDAGALARVLRAALATIVLSPGVLFSMGTVEMPGLSDFPGLLGAPVWPTSTGEAISLKALCGVAAKTGAICFASAAAKGSAPDGRPVVTLRSEEAGWLSKCLREGIAMVPYDAALVPVNRHARADRGSAMAFVSSQAQVASAPILSIERSGLFCAITLGSGGVRVWHSRVEVSRVELEEKVGGISVAVDDDSIVPNSKWSAVFYSEHPQIVAEMEEQYARCLVGALLGNETDRKTLKAPNGKDEFTWPDDRRLLSTSIKRYLIDRATSLAHSTSEANGDVGTLKPELRLGGQSLVDAIENIPFLSRFLDGELKAVSLLDLRESIPKTGSIGYLRSPPNFRPFHFHPLIVADDGILAALKRWSGYIEDVTSELPRQQQVATQRTEQEKFLSRPIVDVRTVGPKGDNGSPTIFLFPSVEVAVGSLSVALPVIGLDVSHAIVASSYCGRMVSEQELPGLTIAVIARFDSPTPDHFENFERLSLKGIGIATNRIIRGATELCIKVLERAREPGQYNTFFNDARVLRLALGLLSLRDRDPRIDENLRGNVLRWPTVQGDYRLFGELRVVDGQLWHGNAMYTDWVQGSSVADLDRPILHVPPSEHGVLLAQILEKLGLKTRAVSDAIASLQTKRKEGKPSLLTLSARPAHPHLVTPLSTLHIEGMEGEMAIYDAGEAFVDISALDGETRRVALDISFPARGVARVDVLTASAIPVMAQKLSRAAVRFLVGLTRSIDSLPLFVRTHLRTLSCRAVQQGRDMPAAAHNAKIFPDLDGRHWSLADLFSQEHGPWSCTFDPPPYTTARQEGKTLMLSMTEHLQLHEKVKILNVTEWMRRDLEGEKRKVAPPVAEIRFNAEARSQLIANKVIEEGGIEGEIGLLNPSLGEARGIQVFTTRRPVCKIADAKGWPFAAVINDDSLKPNRWWTELLPVQETALRARMKEACLSLIRERFFSLIPTNALASTFIDEVISPAPAYGSTQLMNIAGYLYFPAKWPEKPIVRLFVQGIAEPASAPIAVANALISPTLPVCGTLFISHEAEVVTAGLASRAGLAVRGFAARLLQKVEAEKPSDPEVSTYLWNLRLLGEITLPEPSAKAADGRLITPIEVEQALHQSAEIWLTNREGSVDGAFPNAAPGSEPPFVLVNDDAPLMRVLRARLPASRFKVLGGLAHRDALVSAIPTEHESLEALAPPSVPEPGKAPFDATSASHVTQKSWFGSLLERARNYVQNTPLSDREQRGIGVLVEQTLSALRLRTTQMITVHEVRRGRLVAYDKARLSVLINVEHEALSALLSDGSPKVMRRVCLVLVGAAITEINIELDQVTDTDEAQALVELLRQEAALGPQIG